MRPTITHIPPMNITHKQTLHSALLLLIFIATPMITTYAQTRTGQDDSDEAGTMCAQADAFLQQMLADLQRRQTLAILQVIDGDGSELVAVRQSRNAPPAVAAKRDILRDQGKELAERMGQKARRIEYEGAVHLFITMPGQEIAFRRAVADAIAFITQ